MLRWRDNVQRRPGSVHDRPLPQPDW